MKKLFLLLFLNMTLIGSSLHLSIGASPSRINPIIGTDSASSTIDQWIFNSLVTYDKNANVVPELAKSFKFISPILLEFKLRNDIFWSDGVKFSAKDVLFTYETIISPKIFTPYSSSFKHIENVKIIDDKTIHIKYKYPYFKALETWMMGIIPFHILKDEKDLMTSKFNQNPIGTGPYTLDSFKISSNISLHGNEKYFQGKANIPKLIYHFLPDPTTEFMMLKSHELDVGSISPLQLERQIDEDFKKFYNVYERIANSYSYVGFNLKDSKFSDIKVRKALSLGIDRQELVDFMLFGHGKICTGPFMPGTKVFNDDVKVPQKDVKRAKELLKEAGYDENNPLKFTLTTNSGSRTYIAQILQHQFLKIGVHVKIRSMEWQAFLNTVVMPKKFEAVLLAWNLGLKPDAYSIWHSESYKKGGFNFIGYKNDEVDFLIKRAEKIVDAEEFGKIYRKIFKLIAQDVPYLFLYIPNSIMVVNKNISPIEPSLIGIMHNLIKWKKIE